MNQPTRYHHYNSDYGNLIFVSKNFENFIIDLNSSKVKQVVETDLVFNTESLNTHDCSIILSVLNKCSFRWKLTAEYCTFLKPISVIQRTAFINNYKHTGKQIIESCFSTQHSIKHQITEITNYYDYMIKLLERKELEQFNHINALVNSLEYVANS